MQRGQELPGRREAPGLPQMPEVLWMPGLLQMPGVREMPRVRGCRFGHDGGAHATEAAGLGGSVRASSLTRDGIAWPRLPLAQIRCHHKSSDYL